MLNRLRKQILKGNVPPDNALPDIAPAQLDHVIHSLRMSGALAQLTEQQVINILYALRIAGHLTHLKDVRDASYDDGHLISFHNADFLKDPLFVAAYRLGKATNSWSGFEIPWRVYVLCWAANRAKHLQGDLVECGVNRGGFARAVMHYIDFAKMPNRTFYLLDTYCGIPEQDRPFAAEGCGERYSECYEDACRTFVAFPNAKLIRGRVPNTLPQVTADKVCFLSIDMNCAEPEIAALDFFWDKLVGGASVVLDDYGGGSWHLRQKRAFDRFAQARGVQVLSLPTSQGLIIKPQE
jgi:hypothetical protein